MDLATMEGLRLLGMRLRAHRKALDLGVMEIAERAGLSHSYLSRLERGLVPRPTVAELEQAVRGYGFRSLCALIEGDTSTGDDDAGRVLVRHPDLAERFTALAAGWDWAAPAVRDVILATLDALAGQVRVEGVTDGATPVPARKPRR